MATNIRHKRSAVAGKQPIVSQLQSGELAINTADGKIFLLRDDNTVQDVQDVFLIMTLKLQLMIKAIVQQQKLTSE